MKDLVRQIEMAMEVLSQASCGGVGSEGATMEQLQDAWNQGEHYAHDAYYDSCQHAYRLLENARSAANNMITCPTCEGTRHAGIGAGCQTCHSTGEVFTAAELLGIIVGNAVAGPDAAMTGATDCYHVPMDDIDAAREWLQARVTPCSTAKTCPLCGARNDAWKLFCLRCDHQFNRPSNASGEGRGTQRTVGPVVGD